MTYTAARCIVEDGGYHAHEYRIYRGIWYDLTITVHLHAYQAEWPEAKPVDVWRGQTFLGGHESLAEAWVDEGSLAVPDVECKQVAL